MQYYAGGWSNLPGTNQPFNRICRAMSNSNICHAMWVFFLVFWNFRCRWEASRCRIRDEFSNRQNPLGISNARQPMATRSRGFGSSEWISGRRRLRRWPRQGNRRYPSSLSWWRESLTFLVNRRTMIWKSATQPATHELINLEGITDQDVGADNIVL